MQREIYTFVSKVYDFKMLFFYTDMVKKCSCTIPHIMTTHYDQQQVFQ